MNDRLKKLKEVCKRNKVLLLFLFGSQAKEGAKLFRGKRKVKGDLGGDLDVGVVLEDFFQLDLGQRLKRYGYLYDELVLLFSPLKLDLILLQETNYLFQYEAVRGFNLYKRDETVFGDYFERVIKFGSELQFVTNLFNKEMAEAIRNGQISVEYKSVE